MKMNNWKEVENIKSSPNIFGESLTSENEKLNEEIFDLKKIIDKFTDGELFFEYMLG